MINYITTKKFMSKQYKYSNDDYINISYYKSIIGIIDHHQNIGSNIENQTIEQLMKFVSLLVYLVYINVTNMLEEEIMECQQFRDMKPMIVEEPFYEKIHELLLKHNEKQYLYTSAGREILKKYIKYICRLYRMMSLKTYQGRRKTLENISNGIYQHYAFDKHEFISKILNGKHYNKLLRAIEGAQLVCYQSVILINSKIVEDYIYDLGYVILTQNYSLKHIDIERDIYDPNAVKIHRSENFKILNQLLFCPSSSKTYYSAKVISNILKSTIDMCVELNDLRNEIIESEGNNTLLTQQTTPNVYKSIKNVKQEIDILEKQNEEYLKEIQSLKRILDTNTNTNTTTSTQNQDSLELLNIKLKCAKMRKIIIKNINDEKMDDFIDIFN